MRKLFGRPPAALSRFCLICIGFAMGVLAVFGVLWLIIGSVNG